MSLLFETTKDRYFRVESHLMSTLAENAQINYVKPVAKLHESFSMLYI